MHKTDLLWTWPGQVSLIFLRCAQKSVNVKKGTEMKARLTEKQLDQFEGLIEYRFKNRKWLRQALTHSSYSKEQQQTVADYERLEFLGDAVLELCPSKMLFEKYDWPEGKLTKTRAKIVCEASLSYVARALSFGEFILMSYGEEKTGGRDRDSILCDVVEAVIGAVYLDGGLDESWALIQRLLFSRLEEIPNQRQTDYKSALQELLQGKGKEKPEYKVVAEEGPPHDRVFITELWLDGKAMSRGEGKSKKQAAQQAAEKALKRLEGLWN